MKLILVDDNPDFAETMRMLLQIRGYEVECHLNGQDFLRRLGNVTQDDVLITDYYLPDFNGIDLVKLVRGAHPGLKAILLTGSREDGIVQAARQLPACRVAFKPLDYDALHRNIGELRALD